MPGLSAMHIFNNYNTTYQYIAVGFHRVALAHTHVLHLLYLKKMFIVCLIYMGYIKELSSHLMRKIFPLLNLLCYLLIGILHFFKNHYHYVPYRPGSVEKFPGPRNGSDSKITLWLKCSRDWNTSQTNTNHNVPFKRNMLDVFLRGKSRTNVLINQSNLLRSSTEK